ncbi:serglycin [Amia ocellicauda]|uniref:serglycin n=1 Tax=Amia ocellicauda TaxID=2972642 RepID=UPI003464440A
MGLLSTSPGRILLGLTIILLLGFAVQGAPAQGRYMWVKCKPDARNANCKTEKGPWIDISSTQIPPTDELEQTEIDEPKGVTEESSGEGSGEPVIEIGSGEQWIQDHILSGRDVTEKEESSNDYEGSSSVDTNYEEIDYTGFTFPEKVQLGKETKMNLEEENLIL